MTAHLHGRILNVSQLVESHDFSRQQIGDYLDLFEHTFIIRRLNPYFINVGKRLTKRPKVYIRDSGLLHQLIGITDHDTLSVHPARGASWEGFVIEQIIAILPDWEPYFYRTSNGAELDPAIVRAGGTAGGASPKLVAALSPDHSETSLSSWMPLAHGASPPPTT